MFMYDMKVLRIKSEKFEIFRNKFNNMDNINIKFLYIFNNVLQHD